MLDIRSAPAEYEWGFFQKGASSQNRSSKANLHCRPALPSQAEGPGASKTAFMPDRASALVTILFTDLVGSTELLSRAGDEDAQRIFRAHHQLLAETAAAHGGAEVKWLGDGLMVAFGSASDALRCAIAMQQASRRPVAGERLAIRVGLNAGEAFRDKADYFGNPGGGGPPARRWRDREESRR